MRFGLLGRLRARLWFRDSMWVLPAVIVAAAIWLADALPSLDRRFRTEFGDPLGFSPETTRAVLAAMAGGMLTLTGFVFSVVLVAVQFGSSQYSPRLTRLLLRSGSVRSALGVFVATFTYALLVMFEIQQGGQPEDYVPDVSVVVAFLLLLASIVWLIRLLHLVSNSLRAAGLLGTIGAGGARVARQIHPAGAGPYGDHEHDSGHDGGAVTAPPRVIPDRPPDQVVTAKRSGVVQGVDLPLLARLARRAGALVVLIPAVGDFVPPGGALLAVYGPRPPRERTLRAAVLLGDERTEDQDPGWALRLLADIGIKALSPGVNDPGTAVQALDQLEIVLRELAPRHLGARTIDDRDGTPLVWAPAPDWPDYLTLAVSEIRHYGRESVQVSRRLRALLDDLRAVVPPSHLPAVERELGLLDRSVERSFPDPVQRRRAGEPDRQGLGSPSRPTLPGVPGLPALDPELNGARGASRPR